MPLCGRDPWPTDVSGVIGGAGIKRTICEPSSRLSRGPLRAILALRRPRRFTIPEPSLSKLVQKEQFGSRSRRRGVQYDCKRTIRMFYATLFRGFKGGRELRVGGNNYTDCGNQIFILPKRFTSYGNRVQGKLLDKTLTLSASALYYAYKKPPS